MQLHMYLQPLAIRNSSSDLIFNFPQPCLRSIRISFYSDVKVWLKFSPKKTSECYFEKEVGVLTIGSRTQYIKKKSHKERGN